MGLVKSPRVTLLFEIHLEALQYRSTTPPTHGLIREHSRHTSHDNIKRSADVDWYRRRCVGAGGNASANNAHDSVQADGDAVAGAAVR